MSRSSSGSRALRVKTSFVKAVERGLQNYRRKAPRAVRLSRADIAALKTRLNEWVDSGGHGRRVERNLRQERFLPTVPMLAILREIRDSSLSELKDHFRKICRKYKLRGRPVQPSPPLLGRAVEEASFEKFFTDGYGKRYGLSLKEARRLLRRLRTSGALKAVERDFDLHFIMHWATWDLDHPDDPFDFVEGNSAEEVRACLGLRPKDRSKGLFLLRYKLPLGNRLLKPTAADACYHPFFTPPPVSYSHGGLTMPWPAELMEALPYPDYEPRPRTEGVHSKTRIRDLTLPVERLI